MRRIVGPTGLLVVILLLFASASSSQQLGHTLYVNNTDPHLNRPYGLKKFEDRGCSLQEHAINASISFNLVIDPVYCQPYQYYGDQPLAREKARTKP